MAKTDARRRRKRAVVTKEDVADNPENSNTGGQTETSGGTEKDAPTETTETEMKQETEEAKDEQDSQMETVTEDKGSAPTVTVTWEKSEKGETDKETKTSACDKKADSDSQMDAEEKENTPVSVVTSEVKREEGEDDDIKKGVGSSDQNVKDTVASAKGKRKAESTTETSPSKKRKAINDGFCLFVGNLNTSKTHEEVKTSLANYFMTQSVLVQDIRLDRSKKHAFVDLASEMDLTKALTLNGETIIDKPMRIAKAKVKYADEAKVKAPPEDKKAKDARSLFLKNIPYAATTKDIQKIFSKAIAIRFPGGAEGPSKGIAFLEFKTAAIAERAWKKRQGATITDRVLTVERVGEKTVTKTDEAEAEPPPNNTLFVHNLSYKVKEKQLKKVFQKAVSIVIPQSNGKPSGFAFVEFPSVPDAEEAMQLSQNIKFFKRAIAVKFFKKENAKVLPKTLIVMGLAEKTTAETLQSAFEGAIHARVNVDKDTGVSKGFGFVDFDSEENCKAAKNSMEDCEIDGRKVTVAFAKPKGEGGHAGTRGGRRRGAGKSQDGAKAAKNDA